MTFDEETRRDRYFAARDREVAALLDPRTGRVRAELTRPIDCPLCASATHTPLFEKQGFTFVRCGGCGLVFVNPQLTEDVVLGAYRSSRANDLWLDVLASERQLRLDREKFGEILDALEPYRKTGRLLDVGCSIGLFLDAARERGWEGVGIELSSRALAHARGHFGLEVLDVPLADAGLAAESFDAVALLSVLEHSNDPRGMLDDCARVLRPGGALYVVTPNVESLACRVLRGRARTFDGRNHLVYFSPSTLETLLGRAGFQPDLVATRIASVEPVLQWLEYEEPYGASDVSDHPLRAALERLAAEHDLGYKLHCLASKRGAARS